MDVCPVTMVVLLPDRHQYHVPGNRVQNEPSIDTLKKIIVGPKAK
jgi:hypothetical protein